MNFDEIIKESTEKKEQKLYQQQINLEESRQKLSNETTIEELKRQIDRLEQEKELIKLQREKKLKKMLLVWLVVCILGVMTNGVVYFITKNKNYEKIQNYEKELQEIEEDYRAMLEQLSR